MVRFGLAKLTLDVICCVHRCCYVPGCTYTSRLTRFETILIIASNHPGKQYDFTVNCWIEITSKPTWQGCSPRPTHLEKPSPGKGVILWKLFANRRGGSTGFHISYSEIHMYKVLNKNFIKAVRGGGAPVLWNFFIKFRFFFQRWLP